MDIQPPCKRPRIKDDRIMRERIEKFISPLYFSDVNLYSRLYNETRKISSFYHWKAPGRVSYETIPKDKCSYNLVKTGDSFGPTWSTHWFLIDIDLAENKLWNSQEVRLRWNSGSEALIWIDGQPKQGLTGGDGQVRTDYILTNSSNGSEKFTVYIEMAANGMFGAGKDGMINAPDPSRSFTVSQCEICVKNSDIHGIIKDLELIIAMKKNLKEDSDIANQALQIGCDVVNEFQPYSSSSIASAKKILDNFFGDKANRSSSSLDYTVHAIGHCHIDTAWLWPYAETERKCARSWSSVNGLMNRYPNFKFACSQAVQLQWMKTKYPSLYQEIKENVAKGNFIPIGGTWVEMDGNIPSGEAFVRQFLYGQKFFKKEFGKYCAVFWLPDTFGYSAQLPQIIQQSGIKYFLTQKISWSLINKFPHNSFLWQGIDGSKVLTHFPPADTYESSVSFEDFIKTSRNNKDKGIVKDGMLLFGYGDGGGGPTEDMIERVERLGNINGLPRIEHSSPEHFFEILEKSQQSLHTWVGELYLELHQGTFTTHAKVKKRNRSCEYMLRDLEFYQSWLLLEDLVHSNKVDSEDLWKKILLNQFHDVLPGTSIGQVYIDAHRLYEEVISACDGAIKDSTALILNSQYSTKSNALYLLNTLCWERKGVAVIEKALLNNTPISSQPLNETSSAVMLQVPSMGYKIIHQEIGCRDKTQVFYDASSGKYHLTNGNIAAKFNNRGQLVSLVHVKSKRECIDKIHVGNEFCIYTDIPLFWDAWDVMPYNDETKNPIHNCSSIEIVHNGPLRSSLKFKLEISENSWLVQNVSLDADSDILRFDTEVSWNENRKMLMVQFPFNIHTDFATYEIQYGHLKRSTHCNTSWEWAKHEVCGHKWVDLSEYNHGIALINDSKFGFSAYDNTLQMSLLRSPKAPDSDADIGFHKFSYALMPHEGSFQESHVIQRAYEFNNPIRVSLGGIRDSSDFSLFKLNNPGVIIEAIKKCEEQPDFIIIRLYECFGGSHGEVQISSHFPLKEAYRVNFLEEHDDNNGKNSVNLITESIISFEISPFEILSICCRIR